MMNKKQVLDLTLKELEVYLNSCLSNVTIRDEDASSVKGRMIEEVKKLFADDIMISVPYYTNRELIISIGQLNIIFKVGIKATSKTVQVTRLKRKDVKCAGAFKLDDLKIRLYCPYFEEQDIAKYLVKSGNGFITGGGEISLKHRKEKIKDMISKEIVKYELESQDSDWAVIRGNVILSAAQPMIKLEYFKDNFGQEVWDKIIKKTEEVNFDLINQEVEKILTINLNNETY